MGTGRVFPNAPWVLLGGKIPTPIESVFGFWHNMLLPFGRGAFRCHSAAVMPAHCLSATTGCFFCVALFGGQPHGVCNCILTWTTTTHTNPNEVSSTYPLACMQLKHLQPLSKRLRKPAVSHPFPAHAAAQESCEVRVEDAGMTTADYACPTLG